jgi:catechol 2,3-dioxygenase-like lactoylglutathione lyase family enzyme
MTDTALTQGTHHVGLTVTDLAATRDFFIQTLGFRQVGEKPEYPAVFVSDGHTLITQWRALEPERAVAFDRQRNIGLHHLALKVADRATLQIAYDKVCVAPGVDIEFAPQALGAGPAWHMMSRIPGGIRLELIAVAV